MLKNNIQAFLLVGILFFSSIIAIDTPSLSSELVDITHRLNEQELQLIAHHEKVVYLTPDFAQALNLIDIKVDSALKDLKGLIHSGYVVAPYDLTLEAVNHAICLCVEQDQKHASLESLYSYKAMLENGDASLVLEEMADTRSCKTKKFNRICVGSIAAKRIAAQCISGVNGAFENLAVVNEAVGGVLNVCNINGTSCGPLSTCPLLINSDVRICGTINGSTFPVAPLTACVRTTPTTFVPSLNACGNVAFNTLATTLNAVGDPVEADVAVLRETLGFAGSALTVVIGGGVLGIGAPIVIGGTFPTATVVSGAGITPTGPVAPLAAVNLSFLGALTVTGAVGNLTLTIPVTFPAGLFNTIPAVEATYSINNPAALISNVLGVTTLSLTNISISVSNVSTAGMTLNITAVPLGGGIFATLAALETSLATILNGLFTSNLNINLLVAGTTAPAV